MTIDGDAKSIKDRPRSMKGGVNIADQQEDEGMDRRRKTELVKKSKFKSLLSTHHLNS